MLSIGCLLETLRDYIIRMQIKSADNPIDGIEFAVPGKDYRTGTLLICENTQMSSILAESSIGEGSTLLVAGNNESVPLPNASALNIVMTTLSQMELHQMFACTLRDTNRWATLFLEAMLTHNDLQSVLAHGSSLIDADILFLAPDFHLLGSSLSGKLDSLIVRNALERGRCDKEILETLAEKNFYGLKNSNGLRRYLSGNDKCYYHLHEITSGDEVLSSILIVTRSDVPQTDVRSLAELMGRSIKKTLQSNRVEECNKSREMHALFCKIMEGTISITEIKRQLKLAPYPVQNFCSIGIVEFEGFLPGTIPYGHVMHRLAEVFPECNMLVYDSAIVVFISVEKRSMRISFDGAILNTLLEQHGAYMGISNATRNRAMLRTLYLLAKSTVRLAKVLRSNLSERVFLHEDYSMYTIIDLCAQSFQELHHHDDLIYLIHPSIVEISRYDRKHNNNLLNVLYYYLLNDRNLVKTSKAMFMHRNTVINKVAKLTEIIGSDLENGQLQQRLMFSCQFMRYIEMYLEKKIVLN